MTHQPRGLAVGAGMVPQTAPAPSGVRGYRSLFTGVRGGVAYYRGHRWLGPTNAIGRGRLVLAELDGVWGLMPVGDA